jgi:uncharacterized protein (TIGR02996 family)
MPKPEPEYDALYAAVCAAPDDDTPRLVLADWLDEHDDPHRAALIRAQIELERARAADPHAAAVLGFRGGRHSPWCQSADAVAISPAVARLAELVKRETAVQGKAEARWKAVLGKRKVGRISGYRRGFPYGISISSAKQYAAAAARGARANLPGYSLFIMRGEEPGFDAFLAGGHLAGARGFTLFGINSPDPVRKLGARPEARHFRELYLNFHTAEPAALAALAAEPNWAGLTDLAVHTDLSGGRVRFDLPEEFFRSPHLHNLTSLSPGIRDLSGRGSAGLAGMGLMRLRKLDVHFNAIDASGPAALAAGNFPELRDLDLGSNPIGDAGVRALADGRKLNALAVLDLSSTSITDPATMSALIAGPAFPVLTGLSLRDNRVGELDPKRLAVPGRGPTLRLLSLRHCSLSAKAAAALATCPALAGLVGLDLAGNAIGDEGAAALARDANWNQLTSLDLGTNGITAAGVKALVDWPALAKLAHLDLGDNPIGVKGAEALAGCKALKKCRQLVVPYGDPHLNPAGLRLLQEAFGRRLAHH